MAKKRKNGSGKQTPRKARVEAAATDAAETCEIDAAAEFETAPEKMQEVLRLARFAQRNPYRFFSLSEVAKICGFGAAVMTKLNSLGAPVVGRRCNPQLLVEWIGRNADKIGKVRDD